MYIIGTDVDKNFSLEITPPNDIAGTSEYGEKYKITLTAPKKTETETVFSVHLYASNSQSIPHSFHKDNYWEGLIPTWKFYDETKKLIEDVKIPIAFTSAVTASGSAEFYFVDDMPSKTDAPIYIWATLNLDETTYVNERIGDEDDPKKYEPPSYANSRLISVCTTEVNPLRPTRMSFKKNAYDSITTGTYWSNQVVPLIATINSDHYNEFRPASGQINPYYIGPSTGDVTSEILYNFPNSETAVYTLSGNFGLPYEETIDWPINNDLIARYEYLTKNHWSEISGYVPEETVMSASGDPQMPNAPIPPPPIIEKLDWPGFNDLQNQYPDIQLLDYYVKDCNGDCEESQEPTWYLLYLNDYVALKSQHPDFTYIPYALRVISTVPVGKDGELLYTSAPITAPDGTSNPIFRLIDPTDGLNYMTGGYAVGQFIAPETFGMDATGTLAASARIDHTEGYESQFHLTKYWVVEDGKTARCIDDRSRIADDDKEIEEFIRKNIVRPANANVDITKDAEIVKTREDRRYTVIGGGVGISCSVQDPLYNSWICDADTGFLYKVDSSGEIKIKINLYDAIGSDDQYDSYKNSLPTPFSDASATSANNAGISPTDMVLTSDNKLFVAAFDSMFVMKFDGLDGTFEGAFGFPNYENPSGGPDGSWRPVNIDANEYDELAVLFNTSYNSASAFEYPPASATISMPNTTKIVFFDKDDLGIGSLSVSEDDMIDFSTIDEEYLPSGTDRHVDTTQMIFRSTESTDYVFVAGTIVVYDSDHANPDPIYERVFVVRYERPRDDEHKWKTATRKLLYTYQRKYDYYEDLFTIIESEPEEEHSPSNFHLDVDNLFIDSSGNLWFSLNRDYTQYNGKVKSDLIVVRNAMTDDPSDGAYIPIHGTDWITGISEASNGDLLLVDNENKRISRYEIKTVDTDPVETIPNLAKTATILVHSKSYIPLSPNESEIETMGDVFAKGDWTGADWKNKYNGTSPVDIVTLDTENQIKINAYERLYLRKRNEHYDVAEHAKIPVLNTPFVEENPVFFKAVGATLGTDEHKVYSVGKKLFEGLANQVQNIHDIDECHIDSIYDISAKEDMPMDKFILSYPEELRRMADLLSIQRKKLWGDRCHCNQNYFKTKSKDSKKYCPFCKHTHTSNLGDPIQPLEVSFDDLMLPENGSAYLVESKFNRGTYTRITISNSSKTDAENVLDKIYNDEFLTEEEKEMMQNGKTDENIILYTSVLNIAEEILAIHHISSDQETIPGAVSDQMRNAQLLAIHTWFFVPDHWFNYCFWKFVPTECDNSNVSVIDWDTEYTTMEEDGEDHEELVKNWSKDDGMMVKLINYILHNGTLFHKNQEYVYD